MPTSILDIAEVIIDCFIHSFDGFYSNLFLMLVVGLKGVENFMTGYLPAYDLVVTG